MQLFYSSDLTPSDTFYTFDKEESKHIAKVLRKQEGDILHITDGKGHLYTGNITLISDKKCVVRITNYTPHNPLNYHLHLAVAPTKMMERYEWFLEKATEIGLSEITPIICERSERKEIKLERIEKIIISAMKQSLQFHLPKLNPPMRYIDFIKKQRLGQQLIAHCEDGNKKELSSVIELSQTITILIGPEGDFSDKEIQLAFSEGYQPVSLGKTRLRTETAGVYVAATVSAKQFL